MRQKRSLGGLCAAALVVAGCSAPEPQPRSVAEFLADSAVLDGALIRCAERPRASASDPECINARVAAEQRDASVQQQMVAARRTEFERQRAERRLREEQQRRASEAATPKFDPYRSPVQTDPPPEAGPPTAP